MDVGIVGPRHPDVVKCRHCSGCYWLADAEEIGTVGPWRKKGPQGNPAWRAAQEVQEPAEEEYYVALEKNLAKNRHQERRLRVLAWWRHNDSLRDRPEHVPPASEAWRQNLEALARLLDENDEGDRLPKAEVLRELGNFESALEVLGRINSPRHRGVVRQLRDLCNRGDSYVRHLGFEECQDVGALIEIAKAKGGRRLSAIQALRDIGPHARAAVPLLVKVLGDSDVKIAFAAGDALCQIGNWAEQAFPILVTLLNDKRDMIRGMAAKLLGKSGPHARPTIPALRQALGDENCYVRLNAARALQSLDPL
jgi:HEAT repeat protein